MKDIIGQIIDDINNFKLTTGRTPEKIYISDRTRNRINRIILTNTFIGHQQFLLSEGSVIAGLKVEFHNLIEPDQYVIC